jgi:hypothetical protein
MRRRDFITVFGGVAAWPLAAHAQQGEHMRRIGVLMNFGAGVSAKDYNRTHPKGCPMSAFGTKWTCGQFNRCPLLGVKRTLP